MTFETRVYCCGKMEQHVSDPTTAIIFTPKFREFGISIVDGGSSKVLIQHCPWCGVELPSSLRDRWFDELEQLGLEPEDDNMPDELTSAEWWLKLA